MVNISTYTRISICNTKSKIVVFLRNPKRRNRIYPDIRPSAFLFSFFFFLFCLFLSGLLLPDGLHGLLPACLPWPAAAACFALELNTSPSEHNQEQRCWTQEARRSRRRRRRREQKAETTSQSQSCPQQPASQQPARPSNIQNPHPPKSKAGEG